MNTRFHQYIKSNKFDKNWILFAQRSLEQKHTTVEIIQYENKEKLHFCDLNIKFWGWDRERNHNKEEKIVNKKGTPDKCA